MTLDKITIYNFKSIKELEFDIKKYGNSYATMLLGINEVGKSNILEAMSYMQTPTSDFNYDDLHNQKDDESDYVDIYFDLTFEKRDTRFVLIKQIIKNTKLFDIKITNLNKNVFLEKSEKKFTETYDYRIEITPNLFIRNIEDTEPEDSKYKYEISKTNDEEETFEELTEKLFIEYFSEQIERTIRIHEPKVSFWKPSEKYLISSVDLEDFKEDIESNIPLKHIFALAGFTTQENIKEKIEAISNISQRKRLQSTLSDKTTKYVKSIWKHNINIDIEITDSGKCNVSIKDGGKNNEHNYYPMNVRSEGFKQFMSLILSLSIESKKLGKKQRLILIDEPESHLHPSGIRDLGKELLAIGENNYLFVSTHSPFLIDRKNKERNIIIKKDSSACTIKKEINSENDIRDDEVLSEAFGINVYRDLMIPHKLLVEGASDKLILQKAFDIKDISYGITNGAGSNIVQISSKLNHDDIDIMVIVDDDKDGKKYKTDILKIGGVFSESNVFTLRDLVGSINNGGTIEDMLGKDFMESSFKKFYKDEFKKESSLSLEEKPYIEQIKIYLQKEEKLKGEKLKDILNQFKQKISEDFEPKKTSFSKNFTLLDELTNKIKEKYETN